MENFAGNLKQLRREAGLTQEQLAAQLHVTRQAVSRWEQGHTEPDIETLIALGEALKVDTEALLSGKQARQYQRFQKNDLVCAITGLSFALIILLLQFTLFPTVQQLVNAQFVGHDWFFWCSRLLLPFLGWLSLGIGASAFLALFYPMYLPCRRKWVVQCLALLTALPGGLMILDLLLSLLVHTYPAYLTGFVLLSRVPFQTSQTLLFGLLPLLSGIFLFLGFHKNAL